MPLLSADPAAFPTEPPADTHDPAVTAAHDWAAFSALDEMTDHWARPGWSDGSRAYYWMLTFPDDQRLAALAGQCQEELAPLGLDPVPTDGLHITLARVGTPGVVTPASWTAWRRTPRRCCPPRSPYAPCRWPAPEAPSACPSAPGNPCSGCTTRWPRRGAASVWPRRSRRRLSGRT